MLTPDYNFEEAVELLRSGGINAREEAYGFSVMIDDGSVKLIAECGVDNDLSVSMSVLAQQPPAAWFFRKTATEMASLLLSAQELVAEKSGMSWIDALKYADRE